jgi:hypothetical protein
MHTSFNHHNIAILVQNDDSSHVQLIRIGFHFEFLRRISKVVDSATEVTYIPYIEAQVNGHL